MHKNNFDFLRLTFATFVMITHSYALSGIYEIPTQVYLGDVDHLYRITNQQITFSGIGLIGFFSISGYLVFKSLLRSSNAFEYYKKRALRIFPGLIVAVVISAIVGAVVADINIKEYLTNSSPYTFIFSQLSLIFSYDNYIKGVFATNKYPNTVNGSLWTIVYEVFFYIILSFLFFVRHNKKIYKILLLITLFACFLSYLYLYSKCINFNILQTSLTAYFIFYFGSFFTVGACISAFNINRYFKNQTLILVGIISSITALLTDQFYFVKIISLPLIIIPFALMYSKPLSKVTQKLGDVSFGVYIYGFLIQQTLMHYFHLFYWHLALISIPLAYVIGYLSWHHVEKRFLKYKIVITPR